MPEDIGIDLGEDGPAQPAVHRFPVWLKAVFALVPLVAIAWALLSWLSMGPGGGVQQPREPVVASYPVYIETNPKTASVVFRDSSYHYSPGVKLPAGIYLVTVSHRGYQSQNFRIKVDTETVKKSITLEKAAVASTPCQSTMDSYLARLGSEAGSWQQQHTDSLCSQSPSSPEPARCAAMLLSGKISWGGGTHWAPDNMINLCQMTSDSRVTINCFIERIESKDSWQNATAKCAKQ